MNAPVPWHTSLPCDDTKTSVVPCLPLTPAIYPCKRDSSCNTPVAGTPVNCKFICTVASRVAGVWPARTLAAIAMSANIASTA